MRPEKSSSPRNSLHANKAKAVPAISHLIEARRRLPSSASHYSTLIDMLIAAVGERAANESNSATTTQGTSTR